MPSITFSMAILVTGTLSASISKGSDAFRLPMQDPSPEQRAQQINYHRQGYLYGPSVIGNSSYFPTGPLGDELVARQVALSKAVADPNAQTIIDEATPVYEAVQALGLSDLDSFRVLYEDQWRLSNPTGIMPGSETNYTQDLYFSMERLSVSPFSVSRLDPAKNVTLPFAVEDEIVIGLTTMNISALHSSGRLFFADESYLARYPKGPNKFAAACSAYFYIHPLSRDFLPLAIKTNVGSDLIYTPADSQEDWTLAKMMFNSNDLFVASVYHLDSTHAVAEIVNLAALRTMADEHPVRGFLDRIMYRAYAVRPSGQETLFNKGGLLDQNFALNSEAVSQFQNEFYATSAGRFQKNYLNNWFTEHGLLNSTYGPPLKHFPYYEEASTIIAALRRFTTAFIEVYYPTPSTIAQDHELQNWIAEANGPAQTHDFPPHPITTKETLLDILVQMAYLTGVMHHALNSGTLSASWTLPMHPAALYKPIPTEKGVTDLLPYLPNINASLSQIALFLSFNRPHLIHGSGDLASMFGVSSFLADAGSKAVVDAAEELARAWRAISEFNEGKRFDEEGLCQGMPFIWRGLDPMRIPFFLTI